MARIHEQHLVDREDEANLLSALLGSDDPRRVVVVSDKSGTGKTDVLRKLRFVCQTVHDVPVAMVRFDDFESNPDVFSITRVLYSTLHPFGAPFPSFETLYNALAFADQGKFAEAVRSLSGSVDLRGATVSGGEVAGTIFHIESASAVSIAPQPWSGAAEDQAKALIVDAFLQDLLGFARQQPIVLLFDTVDKAAEDLQTWLVMNFLRRRVLAGAAEHRLIVVLAGIELLNVLQGQLSQSYFDHIACVDPGASVRKWSADAVRAFLKANGHTRLSPAQFEIIYGYLKQTGSLAVALMMADSFAAESAGHG